MELLTYAALFLVTTIYALILAWLKRRWDPDLTWVEVAIGVLICLAAPAWLARHGLVSSWQAYEAFVAIAFVVGGFPIAVWQAIHNRRAADSAISEMRAFIAPSPSKDRHVDSSDTLAE